MQILQQKKLQDGEKPSKKIESRGNRTLAILQKSKT